MRKKVLILGLCLLGVTHSLSSKDKKSIPLYKDAKAPIEKRIDDLISRMTLEEKIGQMDMVTVWDKEAIFKNGYYDFGAWRAD